MSIPAASDRRGLPFIPLLQLLWLVILPAIPILAVQLMHTQRWYPACPDFLRGLVWSAWLVCPAGLLLARARSFRAVKRIWVAMAALNTFVFIPVAIVYWGHLLLFRCPLSFLSIQAALQTDAHEVGNFLNAYLNFWFMAGVGLFLLVYAGFVLVFYRKLPKTALKTLSPRLTSAACGLCLLIFAVIVPFQTLRNNDYGFTEDTSLWEAWPTILESLKNNDFKTERNSFARSHYLLRTAIELRKAWENETESREKAQYASLPVDFGGCALLDDARQRTYILIMGEGASRTHMSLYGYPRPTSLALDELGDELFVYDRIISMFGITAPSLNAAFTFPDIQEGQRGIASILTLHREAGFKTYWLNNNLSEKAGEGAAWFNLSADVLVNKNVSTSLTQLSSYDEELLPELEKALRDEAPNKFIVVHLAGMHPTFEFRYPPEQAVYADDDKTDLYNADILDENRIEKINTYDNAMIYNNKNVRAIIDLAAAAPGSAYVLYLSDHSQNLGEIAESFQGYVATGGTQYMYNIPFIVWVSGEYRRLNPEFCARLSMDTHRFGKMDDTLGYSVSELSRISFGRFKPEKSLFSESYVRPDAGLGDGTDYTSLPGGFNVE